MIRWRRLRELRVEAIMEFERMTGRSVDQGIRRIS
jgi:hypothetical protein